MNELSTTAGRLRVRLRKQASLGTLIGKAQGALGQSPAGWIPHGGNLTGSLVQSLLMGGVGYGAGRLAGSFMPGIDAHRLGVVSALGGAAMPWAMNYYPLRANLAEWQQDPTRKKKPWWMQPAYLAESLNRTYQPRPYTPEPEKQGSVKEAGFRDTMYSGVSDGYGIPVNHTIGMIRTDPLMSPIQKAQAISMLERAQPSGSGIIGWPTVSRAAVGAGIGWTAATLFGKALDTVFGGLSTPAQRRLQGAGTIAGILLNTGAIR